MATGKWDENLSVNKEGDRSILHRLIDCIKLIFKHFYPSRFSYLRYFI